MESSKLIQLLATFSSSELFHFKKYLLSPYHNEDTEIVLLFDWIKKSLQTGKIEMITEVKFWSMMFPDQTLNKSKLKLKMSYLLKQAENFLVVHNKKDNKMDFELELANILNQRKLIKHFNASDRKMQKWLELNDNRGTRFSNYDFQYQLIKHHHIRYLQDRSSNNNLSHLHHSLDKFYIQKKLRYSFEAMNFERVRNVNIDLGNQELFLNELKSSEYLHIPVINVYYHAYILLKEPDKETYFFEFQKILKKYYNEFTFEEIFSLYASLQNICIQQVNAGKAEYLNRLVDVYEDIIDLELFTAENSITPWFYKNIITAGLLSNKFDWISQFIEKYTPLLPQKERRNAYAYNMANLHFYKKDYSETISVLNEVEFDDVVYELDGRWLLIRAYYELEEFYSLDSLLSSFRLYLMRNKLITSSRKKQYLNLIQYVQRLMKIQPSDKNKMIKLKDKLTQEENVPTKKWLFEKLNHMLA